MTSRNTKLVRDRKILAAYESQGQTIKELAQTWDLSPRSVDNALRRAREARAKAPQLLVSATAKTERSGLAVEQRKMLEWTADGFERFFNAYSGLQLAGVHKRWVQEALDHDLLLINVPPRHAKSTIFTVYFPLWVLCGANPAQSEELRDAQVLIVSQTDALAKKFTNKISWNLSYHEQLIKDFGTFKPELGDWPWRPNQGELLIEGRHREYLSGDLSLQVRGARQQILGMEADFIIVDDPVSPHNVWSDTERERLSDWMHEQVLTRLQPDGRAICIGQRLHARDLYGELAKEEEDGVKTWTHINFPAVLDWDAEITLWPEVWPMDKIRKRKRIVGEDAFSAMFQQQPVSEAMALAKPGWLYGDNEHVGCVDAGRIIGEGPRDSGEATVPWVRVLSVDPSPTRYWGLVLADIQRDTHGNLVAIELVETLRERMSVRDFLAQAHRILDQYRPDYLIMEENAAQRFLLQSSDFDWLKQRLTILPHSTGRNKGDPVMGVESMAVDFEYGRFRFPYGDAESRAMTENLFDEARMYPQGETDDLLMALWFIKWNLMRLAPKYSGQASKTTWHVPPRLITKNKMWPWMTKRTNP